MVKKKLALFTIIFCIGSPLTAWETVFKHRGIHVETKLRTNGLIETRGSARVPMPSRMARQHLLKAFEGCRKKMKGCLNQSIEKTENGYLIYQEFDLPWPLQNRDTVLLAIEKKLNSRHWQLRFSSAHQLKKEKFNTHRIRVAHGLWEIIDAGKSGSVIRHQIYLEPGGTLNKGIANDRLRDVAIRTMIGIVKFVEQQKG